MKLDVLYVELYVVIQLFVTLTDPAQLRRDEELMLCNTERHCSSTYHTAPALVSTLLIFHKQPTEALQGMQQGDLWKKNGLS